MKTFAIVMTSISLLAFAALAQTKPRPNFVTGTWQPASATVESDGKISMPYGAAPQGKLVFTDDLHFVELLFDPGIPKVASNVRGGGTDAENKAIMAGILALEGRYTVDADGQFSGNTVEGSSFPNWIGDVRTTKELTMRLEGAQMIESFQRPGGAKVTIVWQRAR